MNKRGAELTVGTIVIIVLAVIVLVVLVLGFTGGWGNLWDRMSGMFGGKSNVDSVIQACQVACTTQSENDFCVVSRHVFLENSKEIKFRSCHELSVLYPSLGVEGCDDIKCNLVCEGERGWGGERISREECIKKSANSENVEDISESSLKESSGDSSGNPCCVIRDLAIEELN